MAMMIDPPVTAYSDAQDIRAWIQRLQKMKARAKGDSVQDIERAIDQANAWLKLKGEDDG